MKQKYRYEVKEYRNIPRYELEYVLNGEAQDGSRIVNFDYGPGYVFIVKEFIVPEEK